VHETLARRDGEQVVRSSADKFFRTELERLLEGVTHVVILGTAANGAVLYTSFAACARGLTVVVAVDATSSRTELATAVATWQLLNQPGFVNSENTPLAQGLVTLSRADLIRFD
jgi:nicotinamidase-related amidase